MGLGSYGYSSDISHINLDSSTYLTGGYGGLLVEPVILPRYTVHFTVPILMGGGSTALNEEVLSGNYRTYSRNYENFLFFEPGLNIELSITKIIRLGLGTKYMITTPLTTAAHKELLSGLNYAFNLKLGWF
jgi:hypothetical protein